MRDQSNMIVLHRNVISAVLSHAKCVSACVCGEKNRDGEEEEEEVAAQPKFRKVGLCHS